MTRSWYWPTAMTPSPRCAAAWPGRPSTPWIWTRSSWWTTRAGWPTTSPWATLLAEPGTALSELMGPPWPVTVGTDADVREVATG